MHFSWIAYQDNGYKMYLIDHKTKAPQKGYGNLKYHNVPKAKNMENI
jgi:hypothetical protein